MSDICKSCKYLLPLSFLAFGRNKSLKKFMDDMSFYETFVSFTRFVMTIVLNFTHNSSIDEYIKILFESKQSIFINIF